MFAHISGKLVYKSPTNVVIDCQGVGYDVHISLATYQQLKNDEQCKLYTHLSIKEDAHVLYGFFSEGERMLFRHLISVNGIGAATSRMILSSYSTNEIYQAIIQGNVPLLKSIKGVGPKSAQRIVLELQDKLQKGNDQDSAALLAAGPSVQVRDESISALVMLGFNKVNVEKTVQKIIEEQGAAELPVEDIIKIALKRL